MLLHILYTPCDQQSHNENARNKFDPLMSLSLLDSKLTPAACLCLSVCVCVCVCAWCISHFCFIHQPMNIFSMVYFVQMLVVLEPLFVIHVNLEKKNALNINKVNNHQISTALIHYARIQAIRKKKFQRSL